MPDFVHLHTHSAYSLLDGSGSIHGLVARAAELKMPALALTDHGVLHGAVAFYKACRERELKPIIGCEVYVAPDGRRSRPGQHERPFHLTLLVKNAAGYANLIRLVSQAYLEGFYYRPRCDDELLARHAEGLICLSGCLAAEIPRLISDGRIDAAAAKVQRYRQMFGSHDFFLELQNHGIEVQETVNQRLLQFAETYHVPLVATNDVHYVTQEDAEAHDILLCIQTGKTVDEEERMRFHDDCFHLAPAAEMEALFGQLPQSLSNTLEVAERCQFGFDFESLHLPHYQLPLDVQEPDHTSYLRRLCEAGAAARYGEPQAQVRERLDHELAIIDDMGYASYFLIVWDIVDYARRQAIPVGPGRGSAAGSLVAYVLGITEIDPLRHGLPFERFLNPERVSMPDIDIDFCYERRDELIRYVVDKYGEQSVAQIVTFGTMAARAVIRDVGRVLDLPYGRVDSIAKLVPLELGITLERALETTAQLKTAYREDEEVRRLLDLALQLEGLPRHASVHAAGVVIAAGPLTDYVPVMRMNDDSVVTQYPFGDLEQLGMLKVDFLGLRTLTVMDRTLDLVAESRGEDVSLAEIPLDDAAAFDLMGRGETDAVFQLESRGMRDLIMEMKPRRLEEVIAAVALFRPGPMENIPDYLRNKAAGGRYPHPALEPILAETYGVIVYQEQIMTIATELAGFSYGEADILRRAMGKKKRELVDEMRQAFLDGCQEQGYDRRLAGDLYALVERFAEYGFAKCHSAPYGLLAYQTAYLKANYANEYMAAVLTSWMDQTDKVARYVNTCLEMGLEVRRPDVQESRVEFTVAADSGAIRYGLAAIKHVGRATAEALVSERQEEGQYRSLADLCARVDPHHLNRRVLESLIKAGALDAFGSRAAMLAAVDDLLAYGQRLQRQEAPGQGTLFAQGDGEVAPGPRLPETGPLTSRQRLTYEKDVLGLYLSGHPLDGMHALLESLRDTPIDQLEERRDRSDACIAGLVTATRSIRTRRGEPMAFITLEDASGSIEVVCFPPLFSQIQSWLELERPALVEGRVDHQDEGAKLIARTMQPVRERALVLQVHGGDNEELWPEVFQDLKRYPGPLPCFVAVTDEEIRYLVRLPDDLRVDPRAELLDDLRAYRSRLRAEWLPSDPAAVSAPTAASD